jgi:hypothetical protein
MRKHNKHIHTYIQISIYNHSRTLAHVLYLSLSLSLSFSLSLLLVYLYEYCMYGIHRSTSNNDTYLRTAVRLAGDKIFSGADETTGRMDHLSEKVGLRGERSAVVHHLFEYLVDDGKVLLDGALVHLVAEIHLEHGVNAIQKRNHQQRRRVSLYHRQKGQLISAHMNQTISQRAKREKQQKGTRTDTTREKEKKKKKATTTTANAT